MEKTEKKEKKKEEKKGHSVGFAVLFVLFSICFAVSFSLTVFTKWFTDRFEMSFAEFLYTMLSETDGTGIATVNEVVGYFLPYVIALALLVAGAGVLLHFYKNKWLKRGLAIFSVLSLIPSSLYFIKEMRVDEYVEALLSDATLYEDYYVAPSDEIVKADGTTKNLIYIYLESMETTYASADVGGYQESDNYMPNLTELAQEGISFSDKDGLGGFHSVTGTGWTMGALLATTSGVPFSISVLGENTQNALSGKEYTQVFPGLTTLGDILEEYGYTQEFLCGSSSAFAGRDKYFSQHGNYKIYDKYTAKKDGYIDDYNDWWGVEDSVLYEIAKDELTELAQTGTPFNFTMLTVDTHHIGGYVCDLCEDTYESDTANVVACADSQIYKFVQWLKEQDFYEDCVVVITGDHPRMDKNLIGDVAFENRVVYNCFLNTDKDKVSLNLSNRVFTSFDIFPTVLSAMNFTIVGNRLGLGVDLFSGEETLAERFGLSALDRAVTAYSDYYKETFLPQEKETEEETSGDGE